MILRWFLSRTVRQAVEMRKHVLRLLHAQRDLLSANAIQNIQNSTDSLRASLSGGSSKTDLIEKMKALEETANKWLKPYPHASIRENVEVILVAITVAMAIRTFMLQPMKIPTGSMQPTLYGITCDNLKEQSGFSIPTGIAKFIDSWFYGTSYYHVTAVEEGELEAIEAPRQILPFVKKQRFRVGNHWYDIWFPPSNLPARPGIQPDHLMFYHSGIKPGHRFQKGEDILKLKVVAGDHLFVNRMTYNFRQPRRGEIVIFETTGIPDLQQDTFYIKRLIAIGGDQVQIGNDQHLVLNGNRLDASTPHFEMVYAFEPTPKEYSYFGHVNETVGEKFQRPGIAPLFHSETNVFSVRPNHYLVMGDNTMNSYDSRYWGDFPREKVIGKSGFVYWPLSSRFGWSHR
ncbi:MAG TPA: signal peptidase I [Candidatus Paceibacterota bacterium]|nr:signal peptidase I [Verrucomicrobiota bacterium]HRY50335.1 signal peptidase I [Candidatus Paceibacterota bacterium]